MRLHLTEWGHGPRTAILIHGISNDSRTWDDVAEFLAGRGLRVVAADLRGHGQSGRGTYSLDSWADDLAESLPIGADLAIGHSLGGLLLLLASGRLQPRRAVYEDPTWFKNSENDSARRADFEARKTQTKEQIRALNPLWPERYVDARFAAYARWDPRTAGTMLDGVDRDLVPTAPPAQPSLVLLAENSVLVPVDRVAGLRELGWAVETVAGARHWVHLDQPDAFMARLDRLLAEAPAQPLI